MSHFKKSLLLIALCALALISAVPAEEQGSGTPFPPAATDLSGDWKVLLENANSRKQIRFRVDEKEGRLRGKVASKEWGTQDLDGRREEDGKIQFWTTWYDRGGNSIDSTFKGVIEGEAIVGECRYFNKPYRFRAERTERKDKK